jgi:hypothetical protein
VLENMGSSTERLLLGHGSVRHDYRLGFLFHLAPTARWATIFSVLAAGGFRRCSGCDMWWDCVPSEFPLVEGRSMLGLFSRFPIRMLPVY